MSKGILVLGDDGGAIAAQAKKYRLPVTVGALGAALPYEMTLVVEAGTRVPWDLLPAAWNFLVRWDAAVPLWRYGVLAADVGAKDERKRTQAIVRDLRVLLHSVELLFVRKNEAGAALWAAYSAEGEFHPRPLSTGGEESGERSEKRLAFLRAFYQVKPRLCVLPTTWLAEVNQRSQQFARSHDPRRRRTPDDLVLVELEPGRWAKVHKDDVETVQAQYAQRRGRR